MFNRLKSAVAGAVDGIENPRSITHRPFNLPHKHKYTRPLFLNLTEDAVNVARDKKVRPILSATTGVPLQFHTGYAECINAGKSSYNEDMAQVHHGLLRCKLNDTQEGVIPYSFYGIFDGHAGYGAALDTSKQLHHIFHQKLVDSMDVIFANLTGSQAENSVSIHTLITGSLETSFCEMDQVIKESGRQYHNPGGCTAIVAVFILDDLYVANAGDCRAGVWDNNSFTTLSNDFSPHYDKERIYRKAWDNQSLLGDKYTVREFFETPTREDLGKNILYKDPFMTGWSFKTLALDDLKPPLISGVGRRSRVMGTIGVARGFGDFDLTANHHKIPIKPFLSCVPEIKIFPIKKELVSKNALLIMASDGLWDALEASDVAKICSDVKVMQGIENRNRLVTVAMTLIAAARGQRDYNTNLWMLKNNCTASLDDISVFVIPFLPFIKTKMQISHYNSTERPMRFNEFAQQHGYEISDTESGSTPPRSPKRELKFPECDHK